jgi:hypothetical protein
VLQTVFPIGTISSTMMETDPSRVHVLQQAMCLARDMCQTSRAKHISNVMLQQQDVAQGRQRAREPRLDPNLPSEPALEVQINRYFSDQHSSIILRHMGVNNEAFTRPDRPRELVLKRSVRSPESQQVSRQ